MSLNRRTYSPLSSSLTSFSPSTPNLSPSYSYSRVSTYLDALQRDQTVVKLKRQLTHVKTLQMRYQSLLQQINIAQKQNKALELKNNQIQEEYLQKIKKSALQVRQLENYLQKLNNRMDQQENNVHKVQGEIQQLLEELKKYKNQQQTLEHQNNTMQKDIEKAAQNLITLNEEHKKMTQKKVQLQSTSKNTTKQMQDCLMKISQLKQLIQKYEQEIQILQKQTQTFKIQEQNLQTIAKKNNNIIDNLNRKLTIQQGQHQQLANQLNILKQQWSKIQPSSQKQKQKLYQSIISVQQKSHRVKQILKQLDILLQKDSNQKKYLKDILCQYNRLQGENIKMRDIIQLLNQRYDEKNTYEIKLVQLIKSKLENDHKVQDKLTKRCGDYQDILKEVDN